MQKIFIEKPYRFVQPVMNDWIPSMMNNRLVHVPLLRWGESIVSVESRGVEKLRKSSDDGHAIMLVPNHPQTSDPVVMYDLIRRINRPMFAMASWHLFNQSWFHTSVIRLYGGFSVNREGRDKTAVNFAISALQKNTRPLLIFPEGATTRTNESMMPFLDGPTFIARSAARRRHKLGLKTVIHPVAIRYSFDGDNKAVLEGLLSPDEQRLGLKHEQNATDKVRVQNALSGLIGHKSQAFGIPNFEAEKELAQRLDWLGEFALKESEERWCNEISSANITNRIRNLRAQVFPELLSNPSMPNEEKQQRWRALERTYLAWQMSSYPKDYLSEDPSKDRIIEIASKINEDLFHVPPNCGRKSVILEVCDAIEVPATKFRNDGPDPLGKEIESSLTSKIANLAVAFS